MSPHGPRRERRWRLRHWLRLAFIVWATFAMAWLANSMRTRGVDESLLRSGPRVEVLADRAALSFLPVATEGRAGLVFICGAGVAAEAYAPLLRPLAEGGHPVLIVRLPYRFAPLESHKREVLARVRDLMGGYPEVGSWVLSGHSLGGALAARLAGTDAEAFAALVLVGTTHPKQEDLSSLALPVAKVFASNDGVAPREKVLANRALLPAHTKWVELQGGNHSQFGRYGQQLLDGAATLSREEQEARTRSVLARMLATAGESG